MWSAIKLPVSYMLLNSFVIVKTNYNLVIFILIIVSIYEVFPYSLYFSLSLTISPPRPLLAVPNVHQSTASVPITVSLYRVVRCFAV